MTPTQDADEEIIDVHCGWGATPTAPLWNDGEHVHAVLQSRGIGKAFLASDLARHFDPVRGNQQVAEAIAQHADWGGWLVLHPDRPRDASTHLRRFLNDERFVGGALYPDAQTGRPVSLRTAYEVLNILRRFAKPLLIGAYHADAMVQVAEIAREMGNTKVIASGMGGDDWREAVEIVAKPLNLYLDISGALCAAKLDYALAHLNGARKLLFASGAPHTDPAALLGLLADVALPPDDRARLLAGNARRIFNLDNDDAALGAVLSPLSIVPPEAGSGPAPGAIP